MSAGGWEARLHAIGTAPPTIIDVGAGMGTGPLLRAFPDAYHVLIEPLSEFEEALRGHLDTRRGEVLMTAVGDHAGEAELRIYGRRLHMTSMLPSKRQAEPTTRRVPLTTLDRLVAEHRWQPPFGLKIDTEGADHLVIAGAAELLKSTRFVIAEVWVEPRFEGSHTLAEFIALMDGHGFALRDILGAPREGPSAELIYIDALFMPAAR